MSRAQVTRELIQCIASDVNAGRHVEDTVIGVEVLDRRTTASGVAFAENLLQISIQQFTNPV
jgi:hypothetical protein